MNKKTEIHAKTSRPAVAALVMLLMLLAFVSCTKDEETIGNVDVPISFETDVEIPAGAVKIDSEEALRTFASEAGEGSLGFISKPFELTERLDVTRSDIRIEAAPGATLTIALPEDESYQWPVINTMDAIAVEADDVAMDGLTILVPDAGYNAYNVISVGNARNFSFENGNISGEATRNEDGMVTDYSAATGISVSAKAKGTSIGNSIIKDALTPVSIASGSTAISNLIFNSSIIVSYEYGADEDISITGCTALPSGEVADGGRMVFKRSPYGQSIPESLADRFESENSSIVFVIE